jgi:hypothetical protein
LVGKIHAPHLAWKCDLGGRELTIEVSPSDGNQTLLLNASSNVTASGSWSVAGSTRRDLDGTGTLRPATETFHERWASVLPDVKGLQRVAWNYTWTDQKVCRLQLFAYDQGWDQSRLVWQTDPPEDTIFNPLNVVNDIDGDGVQEVCVAAHYRVMIFEGTTGRKESELRYHQSRPYGWFGLADVDADGQQELITIGDFQSHIDVLEFDRQRPEGERLSVKWRRDIEQDIQERTKWPQVGPHPLANVTGDERPEIVLNLFNDHGDNQWHVVVLDASTGDALLDLPQRFVWGCACLDGTGQQELFVSSTDGVLVHEMGQIEIVGMQVGQPVVHWSHARAAWCRMDWPNLGATWSTTAAQAMRQIALQKVSDPVFFARTWEQPSERTATVHALRGSSNGTVTEIWRVEGLPDSATLELQDPLQPMDERVVRVHVRLPLNTAVTVNTFQAQATVIGNQPIGIEPSMPVVGRMAAGESRTVVVEAPGNVVCGVGAPPSPDSPPQVRFQIPGRGMRDGSKCWGVLLADLTGDELCEIVAADAAPEGHAILRASHSDASTLWERAFPQVPGALPVWNVGALTSWWPGQFRQPGVVDLMVGTRRGLMHSDMGSLLQGSDGALIWHKDKAVLQGVFRWGWAGLPVAVSDVRGDAQEEIACLHPVCYWLADGATGEIVAGCDLASRKALPAWAAYGEPMLHDFNSDGKVEVLLDSPYILALLDLAGTPLWHGLARADFPVSKQDGNASETTPCRHALLDFDADGVWEVASAGYGDGVRAIDARDGRLLWSLTAPPPTCPRSAAANIDGIGGDELLYVSGNQLIAVTGDRQAGRILWTWQGPATLSMPAIADVDDDGSAEVLLQDALGTVYCLD